MKEQSSHRPHVIQTIAIVIATSVLATVLGSTIGNAQKGPFKFLNLQRLIGTKKEEEPVAEEPVAEEPVVEEPVVEEPVVEEPTQKSAEQIRIAKTKFAQKHQGSTMNSSV